MEETHGETTYITHSIGSLNRHSMIIQLSGEIKYNREEVKCPENHISILFNCILISLISE